MLNVYVLKFVLSCWLKIVLSATWSQHTVTEHGVYRSISYTRVPTCMQYVGVGTGGGGQGARGACAPLVPQYFRRGGLAYPIITQLLI